MAVDTPFDIKKFNQRNPGHGLGYVADNVTFPNGIQQEVYLTGPVDVNEPNPYKKWENFKLVQRLAGGSENKMTGYRALLSALDLNGNPLYNGEDPMYQASVATLPGDIRNSTAWRLGQAVKKDFNKLDITGPFKTRAGKIAAGTIATAGTAAIGSWLLDRLGINFVSPATAAAAGGAAALLSNVNLDVLDPYKEQANKLYHRIKRSSANMEKKAMLYHDPRNFILEKLQRDTELSMSDKAMLAGKIRAMSLPEANNLEKSVRSALGVGVGAIIAKYFGLGPIGTIMGGVLGGLASNAMGIGHQTFGFASKPSLYNAFNQGGIGFDTYNQFFRLVNNGV